MIPTGAPVSLEDSKHKWTVASNCYTIASDGRHVGCSIVSIKRTLPGGTVVYQSVLRKWLRIRYDKPVPFTLWQLNALTMMDANTGWIPTCDGDLTCIENVLDPRNVAQDPLFS